ncbi:N,N-dimethylformamidase beta subunit family domain-containing protein [Actinospongicola halichondriae]|uniref:N,N-dimethylformamidase beta subunit family domain-containing protein n=1 Tax=Actinospongicola halichondriae TaxID=3236844 RepID=UPI003D48A0F0
MPRAEVHGYCWPQSAAAGERVDLHLSATALDGDDRPVRVEIARVGATRDVVHRETVDVGDHPTPDDAAAAGCGWPAGASVVVPDTWRSGYYEVLLEIDDGDKVRTSHAFFVVRPTAPTAKALLALSTNTWHAYNDFGGPNLYTGGTHVSLQRPMARGYLHKPPGQGRRVTTMQPPDPQMAAHRGYVQINHLSGYAGSAGWPDWEEPFIAWCEREGHALDICTNADLEDHPELVEGYPLLLSVGHDEYWSAGMRDTVEAHTARGGNVAFFSGNTSFWQVRLEDRIDGGPGSVMVGYKAQFKNDPVWDTDRQAEATTMWSDHAVERPENHMTGVTFSRGGYHRIGKVITNGSGGYTIHRADHWIFDGTGLGYGDLLGHDVTVVGYECDGCAFTYRDGLPYPTHEDGTPESFEILGTAPAAHFTRETATRPPPPGAPSEVEYVASRVFGTRDQWAVDKISHGHAVLGAWTSASGGTVITSGSTDWAHGLAGRDPQIEQITRNILDRLTR